MGINANGLCNLVNRKTPAMHECPWCGRKNLNVYAYCQGCGRGFGGPGEVAPEHMLTAEHLGDWLAGGLPGTVKETPAFWPVASALCALALGGALLWATAENSHPFANPFLGVVIAMTALVLGSWWVSRRVVERGANAGAPKLAKRYTQVLRVTLPAGSDAKEAAADYAPKVAAARLSGLMRVTAVGTEPASELPIVTLGLSWGDESAMATEDKVVELLQSFAGDEATVHAFPRQQVAVVDPPRVRMGFGALATFTSALLLGGVLLSATYAGMSGTGGGGGPVAPPVGFDGTIIARNIAWVQTRFEAPPATEITIRVDNRDAGVPHNIAFYQADTPTGPFLTGCTAGCTTDEARTELEAGPVIQELTFITPGPGTYAYMCEIHPNTMTGVMVVAEGADIPGAQ